MGEKDKEKRNIEIIKLADEHIEYLSKKKDYNNRIDRRFNIVGQLRSTIKDPMTGKPVPAILTVLHHQFIRLNNLVRVNGNTSPVELMINSPGGEVVSTLTFCNLMQLVKFPVYTINTGIAYSAAGMILICGTRRFMYEDAELLLHNPFFYQISGERRYNDLISSAGYLKKHIDRFVMIIKKHSKLTKTEIRKYLKEEKVFTAKEALEAGLIDRIITAKTLVNEIGYSLIEITNELPSAPKEPGKNKKK